MIYVDKRFVEKCWTHRPDELLKLAELHGLFGQNVAANPVLGRKWATVVGWSEANRYQQKTQAEAVELFEAVTDAANGVLPWIKRHW